MAYLKRPSSELAMITRAKQLCEYVFAIIEYCAPCFNQASR